MQMNEVYSMEFGKVFGLRIEDALKFDGFKVYALFPDSMKMQITDDNFDLECQYDYEIFMFDFYNHEIIFKPLTGKAIEETVFYENILNRIEEL